MTPILLAALFSSSPAAAADLDIDVSGYLQTDLRFRVGEAPTGPWYAPFPHQPGIVRNQNILNTKLTAKKGKFSGRADLDLVMIGLPDPLKGIDGLSSRRSLDPFRIEAHALYIEAHDLLFKGVDFRIGQQLAQFGVGDQFNPTNTLNANDVEDPLLFGDQQANLMARMDITPGNSNWTLTGVLVPVFRPALVPPSGILGLANVSRLPFGEDELRWRVHSERELAKNVFDTPTVVDQVIPDLPAPDLNNMQFGARIGGWVGGQDIALSYYRGFSDIPQAATTHSVQQVAEQCNPLDDTDCIVGTINNEVKLNYPRMQVAGFNMAGEMNPLGWIHSSIQPIGYRIEAAVVFPERQEIILTSDDISFGIAGQEAGEYEYELAAGGRPTIVDTRPFAKWVVGLDYTFGAHVYVNTQWVHGMLDEFGAGDFIQPGKVVRDGGVDTDSVETTACALTRNGEKCAWETLRSRLGDYAVVGIDINFLRTAGLFRMFAIVDLTGAVEERWSAEDNARVQTVHGPFSSKGFGMVIYPQLSYNLGNGLELSGGALVQLGPETGKFGDPAAGGSLIWTRARYSF